MAFIVLYKEIRKRLDDMNGTIQKSEGKCYNLQFISKYRSAIMGTAIILIMICHGSLVFSNEKAELANEIVKRFCQFGVDIFLLVSSFGCCYSFEKNRKILGFYKKRVLRIFPPYILVVVAWSAVNQIVFHNVTMASIFNGYSLITFYTRGVLREWYVAAILTLYLAFPLIYRVLKKNVKIVYCAIVAIFIISRLISIFVNNEVLNIVNDVFIIRIPIFLIGIIFFDRMKTKPEIKFPVVAVGIISVLAFAINVLFNEYNSWWVCRALFFPITIAFVLGYSKLLDRFAKVKIVKGLSFLGTITFEIYLTHEKILPYIETILHRLTNGSAITIYLTQIVAMVAAAVVAFVINKIISWIFGRFQTSKKQNA